MVQSAGHGILNIFIFATAALENQFDFNLAVFPLLEMYDGSFFTKIISAILPGQGIDGVGAAVFRGAWLPRRLPESPS